MFGAVRMLRKGEAVPATKSASERRQRDNNNPHRQSSAELEASLAVMWKKGWREEKFSPVRQHFNLSGQVWVRYTKIISKTWLAFNEMEQNINSTRGRERCDVKV
ncbi:hypothetical protein Syun_030094 [Stephania yunnanensis]|uniref:Uncharacterized protein n=1 Tax=Stephania yunnanensis TaxID=152371 RepID=A0AAP0E6N1_9MAGN